MKRLISAASVLACIALVGCGTVQPWQKGNLANEQMAFDADPLQARFAEHTYHSKEGATGGASVGGGGCGCN